MPGPWGQYSGRNVGYKTRDVAMLLNVVLTTGKPYPKQTSGTGPSASCGIVAPFAPLGSNTL